MKILAIQKINEKKEYLVNRMMRNKERYNKGEIDIDLLTVRFRRYQNEYKGFVNAMLEFGLITNKEAQDTLESMFSVLNSIMWN